MYNPMELEVFGFGCQKKSGCGLKRMFGHSFGQILAAVGSTQFTPMESGSFTIIFKRRYVNRMDFPLS